MLAGFQIAVVVIIERFPARWAVSVNTVKTQIQHIYRKLGITNRMAASVAARDLRLL